MTLRPFLIPTVCAFAGLAACGDGVSISSSHTETRDAKGVLKVVETLQCPQTIGSLTRKGSASAAGTVCTYIGPKGAEVSLHLVPLDDASPADVLKAFEQRLSSDLPRAMAAINAAEAEAARAEGEADAAGAAADSAQAESEAARLAAEPSAGRGDRASVRGPGVVIEAQGDDATVRLPGLQIETRGDKASVRIGGFHIDADDSTGSARVSGSSGNGDSVSINARNDAAEIRASGGGDATRVSWILTDDRNEDSRWRVVGYEARGPVGGPLVVATVRSRDRNRERAFEDAKALVALNVGD
ncbi:methyltransferase type 11 [Phenylobacterium sp.]|uniref:methyltransferase type 11 n=1 Tax=Phenylobacterium sp. TaxID=1871053 RepID=UPI00273204A6|nr:methyltransferase type 11 [Phenylobacterium sp.]MDP1618839.1 methyltransferase type 11 [Phenylobacterium sp.]